MGGESALKYCYVEGFVTSLLDQRRAVLTDVGATSKVSFLLCLPKEGTEETARKRGRRVRRAAA